MKKLSLCSVFFCVLVSCSTESEIELSDNSAKITSTSKKSSILSGNQLNPFDAEGKKYDEALLTYLQNNEDPNTIEELAIQIQFISEEYATSNNNLNITPEEVSLIMNDPTNKLLEIMENSSLSTQAKAEVVVFFENLIDLQEEEYEQIYNYIISYETQVLANTELSSQEKENILIISSISTYALERESKRKDKDWETSVGNRVPRPFFNYNQTPLISLIALLNAII
ncbi:hypothetical protein C8C83_4502 [Flavobacterium sp. 90]|uniref:hypothetical protein n=1 Tax=unclassified Flavobacterium TaxID=196869 RepID=UPI000EB2667D|nr:MULTISPECIES: hypothetical protein [unclassified Flavobacterium]RKR05169.1 hypothetical protein C8C82_4843 [Flavobacterium sp. 81]TCK56485.1 hypothetical protein C8C83_4502 [Flavobacterium sp. 90]